MVKHFLKKATLATLFAAGGCLYGEQPCGSEGCCNPCENYGVNAPVCPLSCPGSWKITITGLYWNAHQDGMDYAIENHVSFPDLTAPINPPEVDESLLALNNLVGAKYQNPNFNWEWGFKVGADYCTSCDGWDIGLNWTWYRGKASDQAKSEPSEGKTILSLCSSFSSVIGGPLFVAESHLDWELKLNLVDIELGRNFWSGKCLAIRPFIGVRIGYIDQKLEIKHVGGSFGPINPATGLTQRTFHNQIKIKNDYDGAGLLGGLNSTWNLGCGFAIFGNFAGSILYGKFKVDFDEDNENVDSPDERVVVADYMIDFRASRGILDLGIGLEWTALFCDCRYGFRFALGWENHLFFDQNQMTKVNRIGDGSVLTEPNNTGENVYQQRRGDLDMQGLSLTIDFIF